ncbi:hypothetical protein M427DRAFT_96171 [Gonapodya prolifera JEL478]|uniref:IFT81 calponin homology domain-containing protein n=1 Tax=Gonapodya prolifera (strain JEL478) TaxID=1344416 RepID=A0A139AP05_GONPJ|nr:hypothetical protein M427DRAFT_96171 [Gonapodya prolifera JEL478]|eukprot:KXS18479.1 hypothetical protein M427DRAFT_96171 [Gonapodya prolifera JEL478]
MAAGAPTDIDVRILSNELSAAPLSLSVTPLQLDSLWSPSQLIQLTSDAIARIDSQNPNSPHADVDVALEPQDVTASRLTEFLLMLKFHLALSDPTELQRLLTIPDRPTLLLCLSFLARDAETHSTRAYLARFLAEPDVPAEYREHEGNYYNAPTPPPPPPLPTVILQPLTTLLNLQSQFAPLHKRLIEARRFAAEARQAKEEVARLEKERQVIEGKVERGNQSIGVSDHQRWLAAAKTLRTEKERDAEAEKRLQEQRTLLSRVEARVGEVQQKIREARAAADTATPEAVLTRAREEVRVNRMLLEDTLEKTISSQNRLVASLEPLMREKEVPEARLREWEQTCKDLQREIGQINEKRVGSDPARDATLATLRHQHHLITLKRSAAGDRLTSLLDQLAQIRSEISKIEASHGGEESVRVPKGEEFKKFVADLREKSALYKKKKAEVAEATGEGGILQRTLEILRVQENAQLDRIASQERAKGVEGYSSAQETLEKVSEKKSELDASKGAALQEIAAMVDRLVGTISDKKQRLQPVIAELRSARQKLAEAEAEFAERKQMDEAARFGLDRRPSCGRTGLTKAMFSCSEAQILEQEVRAHRQEIERHTAHLEELSRLLKEADNATERAAEERKAIVGGDDTAEGRARRGGFRTYRDMFGKKITEAESAGRQLKERQREVKEQHEPNLMQRALFADLKRLLEVKKLVNEKTLSGNRAAVALKTANEREQNRLVL